MSLFYNHNILILQIKENHTEYTNITYDTLVKKKLHTRIQYIKVPYGLKITF